MTKLTALQKKQVMKAMELIDSGEQEFCCHAIDKAQGLYLFNISIIRDQFCAFYSMPDFTAWDFSMIESNAKNERLTALALFLAAGGTID